MKWEDDDEGINGWQACKELLGETGRNILIAVFAYFVPDTVLGNATFSRFGNREFLQIFCGDMVEGCCVLVELDDFSTFR